MLIEHTKETNLKSHLACVAKQLKRISLFDSHTIRVLSHWDWQASFEPIATGKSLFPIGGKLHKVWSKFYCYQFKFSADDTLFTSKLRNSPYVRSLNNCILYEYSFFLSMVNFFKFSFSVLTIKIRKLKCSNLKIG